LIKGWFRLERNACAARNGKSIVLSLFLKSAIDVEFKDEHGFGLLHAACQCSLEDGLSVVDVLKSAVNSFGAAMDVLNFSDNFGKLPMDYVKDLVLDEMRRLFPADAAWRELEIPATELVCAGDPWNPGSSTAIVYPYWYGAEPCHVAVKLYPANRRQDMRDEFGKSSLLRFPSLPRLLGWTVVLELFWKFMG
jgi:hypothetical protein